MATYAQRLQIVRDAIDKIVAGAQSVQYADRRMAKADLGELRRLEQYYESKVAQQARAAGGRSRITYVVPQ